MRKSYISICLAGWLLGTSPLALRGQEGQEGQDLTDLSLEDLMKVEVNSVSRRDQKLVRVPSAVTVLRSEDVHRSGATSIAEALRLVPGMFVAKQNSSQWAIGSRGFADIFSNKLLVQIDGRSVYSPLFSGVFWENQDVFMPDLERIEVIRGPGATIWGSNAVNGVVSVMTKDAKDTQGILTYAGGGTEERSFEGFRYGGKIGEETYYRIFGKAFERDGGLDSNDDWKRGRAGFRVDMHRGSSESVTFQGDYHSGSARRDTINPDLNAPFSQMFTDNVKGSGGNLNARWHRKEGTSDYTLQASVERTLYDSDILKETRDVADLDFSHSFIPGAGNNLTWGLGFRWSGASFDPSTTVVVGDDRMATSRVSAFVQNEFTLVDNVLALTLGSKFEKNTFDEFQFQPAVKLAWTPDASHTAWVSVARAHRTPSDAERDFRVNLAVIPGAPPTEIAFFGNDDFESETLTAFEAGFRIIPRDNVLVDVALFYNVYKDLRETEQGTPGLEFTPGPMHVLLPLFAANTVGGRTIGGEVSMQVNPVEGWRLIAGASFLKMDLHHEDGSTQSGPTEDERRSPSWLASIRSSIDLKPNLQLDGMLRYVDAISFLDVPGYVELDLRLGWKITPTWELSIVGQNLLQRSHLEFQGTFGITATTSEVERGGYISLAARF